MKIKTIIFVVAILLTTSCGLFERGGRKYNIEVKSTSADFENADGEAVRILSARLNSAGIRNKTRKTGDGRVEVIAFGQFDADRIRNLLLTPGKLELAKVITGDIFQTYPTRDAALQVFGGELPPNRRILPYIERENIDGNYKTATQWLIVEHPPVIDGRSIIRTEAFLVDGYQISFELDPNGTEKFSDWTGKNIGAYLAIIMNGELKSSPVIKGQIHKVGIIDGRFTKESAEDLR